MKNLSECENKSKSKEEKESNLISVKSIQSKHSEYCETYKADISITTVNTLMYNRILKIDKHGWMENLESNSCDYENYKLMINKWMEGDFMNSQHSLNEIDDKISSKSGNTINYLNATFLLVKSDENIVVKTKYIKSNHHDQSYIDSNKNYKIKPLVDFINYQIVSIKNEESALFDLIYIIRSFLDGEINTENTICLKKTISDSVDNLLNTFINNVLKKGNKKQISKIDSDISLYFNEYTLLKSTQIFDYEDLNYDNYSNIIVKRNSFFNNMTHTESFLFIQLYNDYLADKVKFENFINEFLDTNFNKNNNRIVLLIQSKLKCCSSCKHFLYQLREIYRKRVREYNTNSVLNIDEDLDLIFQYQDENKENPSTNRSKKDKIFDEEIKNPKESNELPTINHKLRQIAYYLQENEVKNKRNVKQIFFQYKVNKLKFYKQYTFMSGYCLEQEKQSLKSEKSKNIDDEMEKNFISHPNEK